jgi:hypothetical protein
MGNKSVFGIASSEAQASEIVTQLKSAGFLNNDVSALMPDKTGSKDFAHEHHTKAPEGATAGGLVGGVLGGGLGWLAGIGLIALPGLGPFIAAGPLMAALSGVAVCGTLGGIVGALTGMGIPEYEARRYEGKIREGNILISVHCENADTLKKARDILDRAGALDIAASTEKAVRGSQRKGEVEAANQP